jgi:hypothetical protein
MWQKYASFWFLRVWLTNIWTKGFEGRLHKYQISDQEVTRREDGSQREVKILNHKHNYWKTDAIRLVYKISFSWKAQIIRCLFTSYSNPL